MARRGIADVVFSAPQVTLYVGLEPIMAFGGVLDSVVYIGDRNEYPASIFGERSKGGSQVATEVLLHSLIYQHLKPFLCPLLLHLTTNSAKYKDEH